MWLMQWLIFRMRTTAQQREAAKIIAEGLAKAPFVIHGDGSALAAMHSYYAELSERRRKEGKSFPVFNSTHGIGRRPIGWMREGEKRLYKDSECSILIDDYS